MALRISSVNRINALPCEHYRVVVSVEGASRAFEVTGDEITGVSLDIDEMREFVIRWVKYRRLQGRAFVGVDIA